MKLKARFAAKPAVGLSGLTAKEIVARPGLYFCAPVARQYPEFTNYVLVTESSPPFLITGDDVGSFFPDAPFWCRVRFTEVLDKEVTLYTEQV